MLRCRIHHIPSAGGSLVTVVDALDKEFLVTTIAVISPLADQGVSHDAFASSLGHWMRKLRDEMMKNLAIYLIQQHDKIETGIQRSSICDRLWNTPITTSFFVI